MITFYLFIWDKKTVTPLLAFHTLLFAIQDISYIVQTTEGNSLTILVKLN